MTLEEFKLKMKPIENYLIEINKAQEAIEILCEDSFPTISIGASLLDSYIELLMEVCNDTTELIPYYIWDCDFGKNPMEVLINSGKIELNSIEILYKLVFKILK